MQPTHCRFSIACNEHHSGQFRGSASSFLFEFFAGSRPMADCTIESKYSNCDLRVSFACALPKRNDTRDTIVLGRSHAMPFESYQEWLGNWCWDAMVIRPADAVRLLRKLRRSGFHIDSGTSRLWDWWEAIEVLPQHQLRVSASSDEDSVQ